MNKLGKICFAILYGLAYALSRLVAMFVLPFSIYLMANAHGHEQEMATQLLFPIGLAGAAIWFVCWRYEKSLDARIAAKQAATAAAATPPPQAQPAIASTEAPSSTAPDAPNWPKRIGWITSACFAVPAIVLDGGIKITAELGGLGMLLGYGIAAIVFSLIRKKPDKTQQQ